MKRSVLVLVAMLGTASAELSAQRPTFGSTLFWESGLINVPAAYVPPLNGDVAFHFSRLSLGGIRNGTSGDPTARNSNLNTTLLGSLWGRAEFGVSTFSADLSNGMFAKLLLVDQMDGAWRKGMVYWLPSVAIGVRNVGTSERRLSRLALANGGPTLSLSSFFGVATRTFVLRPGVDGARPRVQVSLTAGHGNGLFSDDGGLGKAYAPSATGGTFGGVSVDLPIGRFSTISLIAEHDGWAVNAGARLDLRGVRIAASLTEIGAESGAGAVPGTASIVSQKVALTVGWQTNIFGLLRGNRLERSTQQLELEQTDLARQTQLAQQRIEAIEGQIDALRAIERQERSAERVELERMLREERDALARLQDLIKAREAARRPPQ